MKPINEFLEAVAKLESTSTLTTESVKQAFLNVFEGRRVLISYDPQRVQKKELATKLIGRGFAKGSAVEILRNTFEVSRTTAYNLINSEITKKYNAVIQQNATQYKG